MSNADRLIVNAAITGMVPTKADSPHVPLSTEEVVACTRRVRDAGASIVHIHARDEHGKPTCDGGAYAELVEGIQEVCPDIITCVSCSGRKVSDVARRAACLQAGAEMASLTLGSQNFPNQAVQNPPEVICGLARRMRAAGVVPELEAFEPGFVNYARYLIHKEVLAPPYYFNLILGSLGTAPLDPVGLGYMVQLLPEDATWAVGGIGRYQLDANVMAIAAGGHVRVGLEDNLHYDRERAELADNARLVERIVRIGREMGREPASPAEARRIIGLPERSAIAR